MREIRIDKLDKRAEASLNSLDPSRMIAPICSDNALRVYARPTHTSRPLFFPPSFKLDVSRILAKSLCRAALPKENMLSVRFRA